MALPNSRILIHQPSGGFEGQASDIEIHAREVLALRARVDEIYAKHTGQSIERVHADMERDRYFTGEEALAYGLVDRVIERRELACAVAASGVSGSSADQAEAGRRRAPRFNCGQTRPWSSGLAARQPVPADSLTLRLGPAIAAPRAEFPRAPHRRRSGAPTTRVRYGLARLRQPRGHRRARCSSACPASRRDGHDFAPDAIARGAVALVVERPLGLGVPEVQVAVACGRRWRRPRHASTAIRPLGSRRSASPEPTARPRRRSSCARCWRPPDARRACSAPSRA